MFKILVYGPRRAILAVHRVDNEADLQEFIAVYEAMGYAREALVVEHLEEEKAA